MADILFVHNNFPGQFVAVAAALRARGHRCVAIGSTTARGVPDVPLLRWRAERGTTPGILPLAVRAEADLIRGRAAAEMAVRLKEQGFQPDLVIGHPGWGETLFLGDIFPRARTILLAEFFYRSEGQDVGFDPEGETLSMEMRQRVHGKNAMLSLAYAEADHLVCPTAFQAATLPEIFKPRISVIHEGVDTDAIRPVADPKLTLPDGRVLGPSAEVVTYVSRTLEPLRGFRTFMRALPRFLEARPAAEVVIIGGEKGRGYGAEPPGGKSWTEHLLEEVGARLDRSRLHFLGKVPPAVLHMAFSLSRAHVYYTYPFVLSWSLLEAMACECHLICSDTAPVRDAVTSGHSGRLLDFFDADALAEALAEACTRPDDFLALRRQARQDVVGRYDRARVCLPAWIDLAERYAAR